RIVVVVDQFEETFTLCTDEQSRRLFVQALCALAAPQDNADPTALVVLGIRADFYSQLLTYPALVPALQDGQLALGPMNLDELRSAICKPAEVAGLWMEPGLVELLLRDLGVNEETGLYEPGALPMLAHALLATWQQRQGHELTVHGYQLTGGIHAA